MSGATRRAEDPNPPRAHPGPTPAGGPTPVTSHSEWFGVRRKLRVPSLERYPLTAGDGAALQLHRAHDPAGDTSRGPVLLAPGTAMAGLSFCLDTVSSNLVEYLVERGFDVWIMDWRTSPDLDVHRTTYTMDDVARYDWPAAVEAVRTHTGAEQVAIMAHCLSSACLFLSLVRGYLPKAHVSAVAASQVALHLVFSPLGQLKRWFYLDKLIPQTDMIHFQEGSPARGLGDRIVRLLAPLIPKSYRGGTKVQHRHSAAFGDLLYMPRVSAPTVDAMGSLIPQVSMGFLADVARLARQSKSCILTAEDRENLARLALPITFLVGEHNQMFVPKATRRSYELLVKANGPEHYVREVIPDYGHLDCMVGDDASHQIFPHLERGLTR
ncbi:MAG: alpha/beta fold hydrolase [Gemmatimonadota bacterium]